MSTIRQRFEEEAARQSITFDDAQKPLIALLDALGQKLQEQESPKSFIQNLTRLLGKQESVKGLYIWGGVGRGKTFLMDIFFDAVNIQRKHRRHFHRFMYDVHDELQRLKNEQNPLALVADKMRDQARLICFDEFFVSDIADAMVLGNLFTELFARGVTLVATSNVPPDDLYKNGLQRERFLPAIEQLKLNNTIYKLDGDSDYRLRVLEQVEFFHSPLDEVANQNLERYFCEINPEAEITRSSELEINHRIITAHKRGDGIVWFNFDSICGGPRSAADYIEIARCFHTVIVDSVPRFTIEHENEARRFIALVDELYDHNVKLIVSAETSLNLIYGGKKLQFEFQRTESRLIEMQSRDYLAQPHIP
ncbi:MAG: cell division protein ZapE [Pseudomonadota bacterium]